MIQKHLEIGPIHSWLPGAMKLGLNLQGDQVISSEVEFGFLGKGIEKKVEGLSVVEAQRLMGHLEPESAFLLNRILSEAVEKALGIQLTSRAQWIREVTSEIAELNGAIKYLALMAKRLGLEALEHILLKHREELLDLIELLTGSRYGYYFISVGGSRYDITDGFVERLEGWVKAYQADFPRIEAMYLWTHPMHNRLKSLGRVVDDGKMGFVSHASIETTQYGVASNVESRLSYALKQSHELSVGLHELMAIRNSDSFSACTLDELRNKDVKQTRTQVTIETYRGDWRIDLELKKNLVIGSMKLISPSDSIQRAIAPAIEDEQYEDIPLILESLNLLVTELDR